MVFCNDDNDDDDDDDDDVGDEINRQKTLIESHLLSLAMIKLMIGNRFFQCLFLMIPIIQSNTKRHIHKYM